MTRGPDRYYKCIKCSNILKCGSLNFWSWHYITAYTDGMRCYLRFYEFPELTKCISCKQIMWLKEQENIIGSENESSAPNKYNEVCHLNIDDYLRALDVGLAKNLKEELYIRQRIWWAFNNRIRNAKNLKKQFIDRIDEIKWHDNCDKLILLLDESILEQKIMIAELRRNLGDFAGCMQIIENINNVKLKWLKNLFTTECAKSNRRVVHSSDPKIQLCWTPDFRQELFKK